MLNYIGYETIFIRPAGAYNNRYINFTKINVFTYFSFIKYMHARRYLYNGVVYDREYYVMPRLFSF